MKNDLDRQQILTWFVLILVIVSGISCQIVKTESIEVTRNPADRPLICNMPITGWQSVAVLDSKRQSGMTNAGWHYDAYQDLEALKPGKSITITQVDGPAIITHIHITKHFIHDEKLSEPEWKALVARGVVLEVYYNGNPKPAIKVPLGDFFADGCAGKADYFTTPFVEIAPNSYNCFIPMPFEKSIKIVLRNETKYHLGNYSCVEFERLPQWYNRLGYLHATWKRFAFQLQDMTDLEFFHVDGKGHLLGRNWSISTDEPFFQNFYLIMEGNNEIRIDGEKQPSIDYLGSECSFALCWGFLCKFNGTYNGINYLDRQDPAPSMVSVYRFRKANVIRFEKSLNWRVDWSNEFKSRHHPEKFRADYLEKMTKLREKDHGWVDYATTTYWYQSTVGYDHEPMMPLEDRIKPILHPNPVEQIQENTEQK